MNIKKISLTNFRIYKGLNSLNFNPDPQRNIHIVCGYNGFGKTTFLSSLVWCLYGKNMQEVDKEFKDNILEAGGYKNYLKQNLNRAAKVEGETAYQVQVTFGQLNIPGIVLSEIDIIRSFSIKDQTEEVKVLIDGEENELVNDLGLEIFIHDFILPKEVAKFFFFDAEKITALAEMNTIEDKRQLSKAYSEVLGIKKYDDLRNNLLNLRYKYSKASVKVEDKEIVTQLEKEAEEIKKLIELNENKLIEINESIDLDNAKAKELQFKLIKEGTDHSVKQLNSFIAEKQKLELESAELKSAFKEILDLAPFAIAFNQMEKVEKQIQLEQSRKTNISDQELVLKKVKAFREEFKSKVNNEEYEQLVEYLFSKHFMIEAKKPIKSVKILHDFNEKEVLSFEALMSSLRNNYLNRFKELSRELKIKRTKLHQVTQKINKLESKENDKIVVAIRAEKDDIEYKIHNQELRKEILLEERGKLRQELSTKEKLLSERLKKVNLNEGFIEKDQLAERLIGQLTTFIDKIRHEKKNALEKRIAKTLKDLMHKDDFIDKIKVNIFDDIIEISIIDSIGREIPKNDLSKGEQQLYASAILKSFVDESNIEFPVFVDSPLQKFDAKHAKNIIQGFYPHISKQVVIFPLLRKELVEEEYKLMMRYVNSTHIIRNLNQDTSTFESVKPEDLFLNSVNVIEHV